MTGHLVITMEREGLHKRYIKAIKREKLVDPEYRYKGLLRFSYFGDTLIVRFKPYKDRGILSELDSEDSKESKDGGEC